MFIGASGDNIERKSKLIFSCIILLFCGGSLSAKTMTAEQAEEAAKGWLQIGADPIYIGPNHKTINIETITDIFGEPLYYIVSLQPSGFVIVSAYDSVEPIIGFSDDGVYDAFSDNPLSALVTEDISERVISAKETESFQLFDINSPSSEHQRKWSRLITLGRAAEGGFQLMALSSALIADIRVPPLIKSKWSQTTCCTSYPKPCYNYYTPGQYSSGCVATAMAQLMRYHKYPRDSISLNRFTIGIDGNLWSAYPVRGTGIGGAYNWDMMPLDPNCSTTLAQRQAIGTICYDTGAAIGTNYYPESSIADVYSAKDALKNVFKYGQAIAGYNNSRNIGTGLINMINPNLDAGDPVILGINRTAGGHAVLCDGYGYSTKTMYHHLNMGWAEISDAWYNLPDVNAIDRTYNSVVMCIYNIHVTHEGNGEVISGRILDYSENPISDANVYAESIDGKSILSTTTNAKGIYAFNNLSSSTTYTIQPVARGMIFPDRVVTTGTSLNEKPVSGNIWAVDFKADYAGDFDGDGDIDNTDLAIFASAWQSTPENKKWNPSCDLNNPPDNIINYLDLKIFISNWTANPK